MVEPQDISCREKQPFLPKSLSYDGNYHTQFFYPTLVCSRICRRRHHSGERLIAEGIGRPDEGKGGGGTGDDGQATGSKADVNIAATAQQTPENIHGSMESPGKPGLTEALVQASNLSEKDTLSSCASLQSCNSEDTDFTSFSEDYTDMTEVGDASDLDMSTPMNSLTGDFEMDSSYGDDRSSTCTVEDGDNGGGCCTEFRDYEDINCIAKASDNGCDGKPLHEGSPEPGRVGDKKLNIKLLLRAPTGDMDEDGAAPLSPESNDDDPDPESDGSANFHEDREFDFLKAEPVKRSTSLKTYKTPPGTPRRKKAVRFADALGLDLESIRHILNQQEPPTVPTSAMRDLKVGLEEEHRKEGTKFLCTCFSQPGAASDFMHRVETGKVVLENCVVGGKDMTISGSIRVANISFHKKVIVRSSTNNWLSFDDVCASYVQNSNDGATDRFSFTINVPSYFSEGSRLMFAIMFVSGGNTYWDSNYGANYAVECYAKALPTSESDNTWMHFL